MDGYFEQYAFADGTRRDEVLSAYPLNGVQRQIVEKQEALRERERLEGYHKGFCQARSVPQRLDEGRDFYVEVTSKRFQTFTFLCGTNVWDKETQSWVEGERHSTSYPLCVTREVTAEVIEHLRPGVVLSWE